MIESTAVVTLPSVFVFDKANNTREDELLFGWAVKIKDELEDRYLVTTHYGFDGYVEKTAFAPLSAERIKKREHSSAVILNAYTDVLSERSVKGEILVELPRGSIVETVGAPEDGFWSVVSSDGSIRGYVREGALGNRLDNDDYLIRNHFDFRKQARLSNNEIELRTMLVTNAMSYLGTPYRWGGKTPKGADCSGVVSMTYMLSGILIYRNSWHNDLYPVKPIAVDNMMPGDLIRWDGHVGMYIGNSRFIHCTGNASDYKCVISSLTANCENYRPDLASTIIGVGSIF